MAFSQINKDFENFIFQQGETALHWHRNIQSLLNKALPQRWIGLTKNPRLNIMPRSDLSPCNFF